MIARHKESSPVGVRDALLSGHVLVIALENVMRRAISDMLGDAEFDCQLTNSYESALQICSRNSEIKLVVFDCIEPDLEAWWFVEQLKSLRPDVTLVGSSDHDQTCVMRDVGIDRCLPKFWETEQLLEVLRN